MIALRKQVADQVRSGLLPKLGAAAAGASERAKQDALGVADPEASYWIGALMAYCGHREPALELLRSAISRSDCSFPAVDRDPLWTSLRDDPEVAQIRRLGNACRERFLAHRRATGRG